MCIYVVKVDSINVIPTHTDRLIKTAPFKYTSDIFTRI